MPTENLLIDLHIHSKYSFDSFIPINKIIKIAKKKHLDGVAITDHNTIEGGVKANKLSNSELIIIIGSEITLNNGAEVLGLFLNEYIKSKTFFEVYDEIKDQDGVMILPHPFRASKNNFEILTGDEFSKINIIEGINAGDYPKENEKAMQLAKEKSLIVTGGSDAHHYSSIGKAYTIFRNDYSDLRKELIKGNIKISGRCLTNLERQREYLSRELKMKNYKIIKDGFKGIKDRI